MGGGAIAFPTGNFDNINSQLSTIKTRLDSIKDYIISSGTQGTYWYRIWNSGFKECGGYMAGKSGTCHFPHGIRFNNSNYSLTLTAGFYESDNSSWVAWENKYGKAEDSFVWNIRYINPDQTGETDNVMLNWEARGF